MNPISLTTNPGGMPSWLLFGVEPLRAVCEFAGAQWMDKTSLPQGDGHPVVLFPGLASDSMALAPLKSLCAGLGYAVHDWGRGFNTGPQGNIEDWLDALAGDVLAIVVDDSNATDDADGSAGQPISLIGWSLGGFYAREVGKRLAGRVRQVITIGTPFAGLAQLLFDDGLGAEPDAALMARLAAAPPVPTTSIYSRSDGVVGWHGCVQHRAHAGIENIEVRGSHFGLGWNPEVFTVIAKELARRPQRRGPR